MATGDDAVAAGMALVPGDRLANQLDTADNETRDYIANGHVRWKPTLAPLPISKGGCGATTAAAARTALGITAPAINAVTQAGGQIVLRWDATSLSWIPSINGAETSLLLRQDQGDARYMLKSGGDFLPLSGGTMIGHLYSPPARSTPVTTSYVAAYLNGDGRLGATASARRYKRDIKAYEGSVLDLQPVTYILRDDEKETVRLGLIAEDTNDVEPLLVVHEDDKPESVKYELLAVALLAEVQRLAGRVTELEARP